MSNQKAKFNLIPFEIDSSNNLKVTGNVSIIDCKLTIEYYLQGDLSQVIVPTANSIPSRKKDLWEHTCFEFFLKPQGTNEYWEFNLSPNEDWNIFHLSNYRENLTEEKSFSSLPFNVEHQNSLLKVNLEIDLHKIISSNVGLNMAISTVIETKDYKLSYWSLIHPGIKADFHHQDSFILLI